VKTRTQKRPQSAVDDRLLFRLDFALRGHAAYCEPACLKTLIALVEETTRRIGAPLLRYHEQETEVA
jgi:hypothetical protein